MTGDAFADYYYDGETCAAPYCDRVLKSASGRVFCETHERVAARNGEEVLKSCSICSGQTELEDSEILTALFETKRSDGSFDFEAAACELESECETATLEHHIRKHTTYRVPSGSGGEDR